MGDMSIDPHILDWQEGVARVINNRALYGKLLGKFAVSQADALRLAGEALAAGDTENARHIVHTLKGTAANLSAHALAEAALALEIAVKNGADTAQPLKDAQEIMEKTLEAMKNFQA